MKRLSIILSHTIFLLSFWGCQQSVEDTGIDGKMNESHYPAEPDYNAYGDSEVEYSGILERGLPIDSVMNIYSLPDEYYKMRLNTTDIGRNNAIGIHAIKYLKDYNKKLWHDYFERASNCPNNRYPIVSVYEWYRPNGFSLSLVCIYGTDREYVIYGRYHKNQN